MEPTIIFLIGLPASGKSTIGKRIAAEYNFCYLDKDIVCNHFTGLLLELKGYSWYDREGSFYSNVLMDLDIKHFSILQMIILNWENQSLLMHHLSIIYLTSIILKN